MNKLLLKKWSKGNDLENTEGVAHTHPTTETLHRKNNNSTTRERASRKSIHFVNKKTNTIVCTIKNIYAAKHVLFYGNYLTICFASIKKTKKIQKIM